ncbi:MAG: DegT/DnrJ/EryC1/StrS family aminotransferase, partial [Hoylesella buccalis]
MIPYLSLQRVTNEHLTEIKQAVNKVAESGWYLQGQAVQTFEKQYAEYIGTRHCVSCANGLDALTLILRAYMELGEMHEGDEIIVPSNTYIATILSITANHLVPVLVEPRIDTLEIDDNLIEQAITEHTKGIMLVHLYGRCAYTEKIGQLCQKHHLKLLEDNAQAHGCLYNEGHRTGSLGDAAAHSFYPSKNLGALGDAGAVTTDDAKLANVIRSLGNYGSSRKYVFDYKG